MNAIPISTRFLFSAVRCLFWNRMVHKISKEDLVYVFLILLAFSLRLWELDSRPMHYDESLHLHYSWQLARGDGYSHSPWMHGPFQIHLTAFLFVIFGDNDFIARLGYALFGALLVGLPYFLRSYIGTVSSVVISLLLVASPTLLYFSRFGRNEIIMAFWAIALLVLIWRYLHEGKHRYLYLIAAVLALAFATKETTYILVIILGSFLFLLSLPDLIPWSIGRIRSSDFSEPAVLFVLIATITLPQWAALTSPFLEIAGVKLVTEGVGKVGLPVWGSPFVAFPLTHFHWTLDAVVLFAIGFVSFVAHFRFKSLLKHRYLTFTLISSTLLAYALIAFPSGSIPKDYLIAFAILFATTLISATVGFRWNPKIWLTCAIIFYFIWGALHTSIFGLFVQSDGLCPQNIEVPLETLCSRLGGLFTGSWQGLGYWIVQHDVARGGQPWYYYLMVGYTYEFLPFIVSLFASFYYLRKTDLFGLLLVFWSFLTLIAYSFAGEKMPWLVVNITVPFLMLTGKFFGDIIRGINHKSIKSRQSPTHQLSHIDPYGTIKANILRRTIRCFLLPIGVINKITNRYGITVFILTPVLFIGGIYVMLSALRDGSMPNPFAWLILIASIIVVLIIIYSAFRLPFAQGIRWITLSLGLTLFAFGTFVGFRASYSDPDTPVEILAYAQGSVDIRNIARTLEDHLVYETDSATLIHVDYDLWYPLQWYTRNVDRIEFQCFKLGPDGHRSEYCDPPVSQSRAKAILLASSHTVVENQSVSNYKQLGPFKNILWFPENYRRSGENRGHESLATEVKNDIKSFWPHVTKRDSWYKVLDYFIFRTLDENWWNSTFYAYLPEEV